MYLMHYGTPRHSGRYPWGSGKNPYQHARSFLGQVKLYQQEGLSEAEIAKLAGMSTTKLRALKSIAVSEKRAGDAAEAFRLKEKGMSNVAIGERLGVPESTVRNLLKNSESIKTSLTETTADALKKAVDSQGYIDIGVGVERYMGVSRTRLQTSVEMLKEEGYTVHYIQTTQLGTGKKTSVMVLAKPDTPYSEVSKNRDKIKLPGVYTEDGGVSFSKIEPPKSVSSKRVGIRYAEEGGLEKDGVIELRRGVDDISLGKARYAQVRIAVDGTHYIKGMAMYSDNLPDGVDILFNTNKHNTGNKLDALKKMKDDPDNPFGATIKSDSELILAQRHYVDANGQKQQSVLNIVNEEGNWGSWSKTLSSQFLSKQSPALAKKQLDKAFDERQASLDEIMSLTNPVIKRKLLETFGDECDSAAVHLKAAAMPRQGTHVILPFPDMKETEIYAPNFRDGERVALVRYPHGGIFEIPELTVNNKHKTANSLIHNAIDAVGINSKVAERLSGADFDGDTVLVIPNNSGAIRTSSALQGLKGFDPKTAYPAYEGMRVIKPKTKQAEMGKVSNLITDMTIKGATPDEIARAVRHSMVVIDAEKHKLNWKQSYIDNGIADLKEKYQGRSDAGASTLISRASSEVRVTPKTQGVYVTDSETGKTKKLYVDPSTGKKLYTETPSSYTKVTTTKKGEVRTTEVARTQTSTRMAEVEDAFELSSGTRMEAIYATHANRLKALGNAARKEAVATPSLTYSPTAKKTYATEVASLQAKLNQALKNAPLERQAQLYANTQLEVKKRDNPGLKDDYDALKKEKGRLLTTARLRVGAGKQNIQITEREWEAIQAGAISSNFLKQIMANTDMDKLKQLALPKSKTTLSSAQLSRIKSMIDSGYTQSQIATALGVSISTIINAV